MTEADLYILLPLAATANWQLVETWHHGSIFENVRAWFEAKGGLASELVLCPFCLSHWTAAAITLVVPLGDVNWVWRVLFWLAVVRLSNVCNDIGHPFWRTAPNLKEEMAALGQLQESPEDHGTTTDGTQEGGRPISTPQEETDV